MAKAFDTSLLHPRNWLTWFGLAVLWLMVQPPLSSALHSWFLSGPRVSSIFEKKRKDSVKKFNALFPCYERRGKREIN